MSTLERAIEIAAQAHAGQLDKAGAPYAARHPVARRVKLADIADNLDETRIAELTERDRARLARYQRARELLLEAMPPNT